MPKPDVVVNATDVVDEAVVIVVESDNTVKKEEPKPDEKDTTIKNLQGEIDGLKKQVNYASGSYRIIEKLQQQVADLIKKKSEPADRETPVKTDEELAELFNKDIVAGVSEVVRRTFKTEKEQEKKEKELEDIRKEQTRQIELMERNQQAILDKYPELGDATSEYTKIWLEVLDKHPEYKTNYLGPVTTMKEMEDECRRRGLKVKDDGVSSEDVIEKEVARRTRVKETSLKPGAKTKPAGGEIVLTQDQVAFCRHNNIQLKDYAVTLKRLSGEKKVEA